MINEKYYRSIDVLIRVTVHTVIYIAVYFERKKGKRQIMNKYI